MNHAAARPKRERWFRAATWMLAAALVSFLVFCLVWRIDGGRWVNVETPSMGEQAPVGSLLWLKPTDFDKLQAGDFITFHPPGSTETTYSHRVLTRNDDGTLTTKGVIPAADPWRLTEDEVVGQVQMNWWGAGWLIVTGPFLLLGFLIVGGIAAFVRKRWKLPVTLIMSALVLSLAMVLYQPMIGAKQLAFAPNPDGAGATATYVGTGLLPIRLSAHSGESTVMHAGEVGTVQVTESKDNGKLEVDLRPAIPWWWWVALVLACFVPALYSLLIGLPRPRAVQAATA